MYLEVNLMQQFSGNVENKKFRFRFKHLDVQYTKGAVLVEELYHCVVGHWR